MEEDIINSEGVNNLKNEIKQFCRVLNSDEVEDAQKLFLTLPRIVQDLFIKNSWNILSKQDGYVSSRSQTAVRLFKLFESKKMQNQPCFQDYKTNKEVKVYFQVSGKKKSNQGEIGLIIHYGLYSVPAYDHIESVRRRRTTKAGAEWYYARLTEDGNYRPMSGYKQTQEYHQENYGDRDYYDFVQDLTVSVQGIKKWIQTALDIGATYIVLTSKHHDGFCLWDTKTTERKKDILTMFVKEARKAGLKVGIYYSLTEFDSNPTKVYIDQTMIKQLNELLTLFKPDFFWFDGQWKLKSKYALDALSNFVSKNKIKCNDRLGKGNEELAEFYTFEDKMPDEEKKLTKKYEIILPLGSSWGCNMQQEKKDFRQVDDIKKLISDVVASGNNILINIGPQADGSLCPYEQEVIDGLKKN